MSGTSISNNITTKFSGTQVAVTAGTGAGSGNLYTVPANKTLVGCWYSESDTGINEISIGGIVIGGTRVNQSRATGPLYVNGGSVISYNIGSQGRISIHGVLMENTP